MRLACTRRTTVCACVTVTRTQVWHFVVLTQATRKREWLRPTTVNPLRPTPMASVRFPSVKRIRRSLQGLLVTTVARTAPTGRVRWETTVLWWVYRPPPADALGVVTVRGAATAAEWALEVLRAGVAWAGLAMTLREVTATATDPTARARARMFT